ncbi:hypothetical protein [Vibrio phage 2 TSL-2019]|uniref:Uncharacterized protein n=1 Tax=Vibrio phage 2 TSL-2019 TaxID=2508172 RepID=A0A513PW60_9CAUD|nr:hypothetical protein HWC03_gp020 [Vibrio phage 2 TSL-2019]QAU04175.1 hypothetical protein [Vibrio phage 2 TSL-2019]
MELAYKHHALTLLKELTLKLGAVLKRRLDTGVATEAYPLFNVRIGDRECQCTFYNFGDEVTLTLYGLHALLEDNVQEGVVYRFNANNKEEVSEVQDLLRELLSPYFDKYLTRKVQEKANELFFTRIGAMKETGMFRSRSWLSKEQVVGFFYLDSYLCIEQVLIRRGRGKGRCYYHILRTSLLGKQTKEVLPCPRVLD